MNYITFNDFLNCVYVPPTEANQRPSGDEILEGLLSIYSGESPDLTPNENVARKTVQGLKVIGAGVVKIVHRCKDARASLVLDLGACSLLHLPEGVLHLMKHYEVVKCNLSDNRLSQLSPKFGSFFSNITSLDLSYNNISNLPKDITLCKNLQFVDISVNSFVAFPYELLAIHEIVEIKANQNFIAEVDGEALECQNNLEKVNLEENPLTAKTYEELSLFTSFKIILSERKNEEWEDLSI